MLISGKCLWVGDLISLCIQEQNVPLNTLCAGDALSIPEGWTESGNPQDHFSHYGETKEACIGATQLWRNSTIFQRTLEALILPLLSPAGAEVLSQKFDEMDQQTFEEVR